MSLNKIKMIFLASVLAALVSGCGAASKTGAVIAGSTSLQPYVEMLAEHYATEHPEIEIDVQGGGSSAGIKAAKSGTADVGMSSRELKGDDETYLWSSEIAKDGLALIIHPKNPVDDLTLEQIRDIYTGKITGWDKLSSVPFAEIGYKHSDIHIIAREEGSGTKSAFDDLVMGKERITPKAIVQDSNGSVRQIVSSDPNAIGFISLGLVDETVKPVKLGGIAPTRENVESGSYKLMRPFLFVADGEPAGNAKLFVDFVLSPEGQKLLGDEGLIPTKEQ